MNNSNFFKDKKIMIAVFLLIVIAVFVLLLRSPQEPAGQPPTTPTSTPGVAAPPSAVPTVTKSKTTQPSVVKSGIVFVSPLSEEIWVMHNAHEIRWTRQEGHNGSIRLINAASKAFVGWITTNLTPDQVTFGWDTSRVFLSRTDPTKKEILPGTYKIQILFDTSNVQLESGIFQIANSGADKILSHEVFIKTYGLYTPNFIEVPEGEQIVIINDDSNITHTIKSGGVLIAKLAPGDSYAFAAIQSGQYQFGVSENQLSKLQVTVK